MHHSLCLSQKFKVFHFFNIPRCIEAEAIFLPNATEETLVTFRLLLDSMNNIEFGALDEFEQEVFDYSSPELTALNLTELYEFTMLTCSELFTGNCWWRNRYLNCCENFFELQKSEYGICYSFNSAVHEVGAGKSVSVVVAFLVLEVSYN